MGRTIGRRVKESPIAAPSLTAGDLAHCEGFRVESPDGPVGWVEEVWLGVHDEPRALAVKRLDGRRGLLAADDVTAVVREQEWVVVRSSPPLLELDAPRLETRGPDGDARLVASWATTGAALPPALPRNARRRPFARAPLGVQPATERESGADQVVWHAVGLLYVGILGIVTTVITLAFLAAYVVTGRAI